MPSGNGEDGGGFVDIIIDVGTRIVDAVFGGGEREVDPTTGEPLEGGGRYGDGLYCPIVGTPQTVGEVRAALDRTPDSRLQQLHELVSRYNGHQGLTGDYRVDLYERIEEWPRWALGGDNCYIDNPAGYEMKRDFLEWWEQYGSGGLDTPPPRQGGEPWWETAGRIVVSWFSDNPQLPPGSQPRILGVTPGTLVLLVVALIGVYLWTSRR